MPPDEGQSGNQLDQRWRPALMAFFLRRVQSYAEAEDLTQEVFARLLVGKGTTDQPDVYVFRTAQNLLVDRVRKLVVRQRYRETALTEPEREFDVLDPHTITASREEMAVFLSALATLPERTRTMFILYRLEHLSQDDIAATFGISTSAVKQQIAKATALLTKQMQGAQ
ncbi:MULTISPECIES: RNA polymerase sigma factor [Sphingopyxis]|uniref:RNA polymerase sigma factor n=1 Tax=Sphingopyxis TaxID=165697 RepID=UPI0008340223|nr:MULTISPECIES: sigma-70 family RNA polymerase sigma factor [Sphingopyxis]HEX2812606.1 sigma-70 family RNA polymerase sigma factor [Sphingopyxis sp.]